MSLAVRLIAIAEQSALRNQIECRQHGSSTAAGGGETGAHRPRALRRSAFQVFDSRAPEELWTGDLASKVLERGHGFLRDKPTQTIATHSTFPYLSSLPPEDWFRDLPRLHCFANKNLRYKSVYFTFLFVAFNSNDVSLFGTALVRAVVQWKWHTYGKYFFIVQGVFYFLQLFFISAEVRSCRHVAPHSLACRYGIAGSVLDLHRHLQTGLPPVT